MFSEFFNFLKNFKFLTSEDIKSLSSIARIKKYAAGDIIVHSHEVYPFAIFVINGLLRNYAINDTGEERTLKFTEKKNFTATPNSLFLGLPSKEIIEALEPSTVILINSNEMSKLAKNRPNLLRLKIKNMEQTVFEMTERLRFFALLSPEKRYLDLTQRSPDLVQRVEDRHLASFIGITAVSFSRIKNRVNIPGSVK